MQFSTILSVFALVGGALSQTSGTGSAGYDLVYDNPETSTLSLACSDGVNGLYTKGHLKLSDLPRFPRVAAAETVTGWNSPKCGACYNLTWEGVSVSVVVVDHTDSGFVLSLAALDTLAGGQGAGLGRVNITWEEAIPANCGF